MNTTPTPFTDARDVASRQREILASISAKVALRPKVDTQGHPIADLVTYRYDPFGRLLGPADNPPLDAA